ncbi:MAG: ABC transporter ATP-binding protein [Firmicutes bacterium]|nr:ABC transporter ATP-binding protein [Bacillota bacterium]
MDNEKNLILDIKGLEVTYETNNEVVHAVNKIDLQLEKGKTLGLVGETGAGKTTTALSIMRLLPERTGKILGGEIIFDGDDLLKMSAADMRAVRGARISMIFQDPMTSLNPVHSVGKQIYEALMLHNSENKSSSELEARVDEILELVGIPARRKKEYPHQFSGGMKQRVVIAIALACNPELLIADEPTTALDVTIQAQVLAMMAELRETFGMSMVMITHDLGVIAATCDTVAVMYAGEIIEFGKAEDIFSKKAHHPYTEGLFKAIPNLKTDSDRLEAIDGLMPDPTNLPAGCKFAPRCKHCMEICKTEDPKAYEREGLRVACHLFADKEVAK